MSKPIGEIFAQRRRPAHMYLSRVCYFRAVDVSSHWSIPTLMVWVSDAVKVSLRGKMKNE